MILHNDIQISVQLQSHLRLLKVGRVWIAQNNIIAYSQENFTLGRYAIQNKNSIARLGQKNNNVAMTGQFFLSFMRK